MPHRHSSGNRPAVGLQRHSRVGAPQCLLGSRAARSAAGLTTRWATLALLASIACVAFAPVAAAAEVSENSLQRARVDVVVRPDGAARLEATYTLSAALPEPTVISHHVLPREDSRFRRLEIAGAGSIERSGATTYAVSLPKASKRYTLVSSSRAFDPNTSDVPVPVPDIPAHPEAQVSITVTLPQGQRLVGDSLPSFTSKTHNGHTTLTHSGPALPSALVTPFGTSSVFTLGDALTILGLGVLTVTGLLWFAHGRREHTRTNPGGVDQEPVPDNAAELDTEEWVGARGASRGSEPL